MDFPDIIYRNNNYVENVNATGNNEYKNMIFIQQFYAPKQPSISLIAITFNLQIQERSICYKKV